MKRREFIRLLGGAAVAWPLTAHGQQGGGMRRIGVLMGYAESNAEGQAFVAAFRDGLLKLGWVEGRNIRSDYRWAITGDAEATPRFAKELVAQQPDLILTHNTPTTSAVLEQTRDIPIVFAIVADPVSGGFVASLARPGGNATGFTTLEPTLGGKWLELLKEIAPRIGRAAFLFNPTMAPFAEAYLSPFKAAAQSFAVGGGRRACSRQVRARIGRGRTGARAEWRLDRHAGYVHVRPSRAVRIAGGALSAPGNYTVAFVR